MNLTCFWVICRLSADGRNLTLNDLNGLYRRAPVLAFVLAVAALALVGLPPTAGFMGKLFLLSAAWDRGYDWLVVVAAAEHRDLHLLLPEPDPSRLHGRRRRASPRRPRRPAGPGGAGCWPRRC